MMTVGVHSRVAIYIWARATTWVANEMAHTMLAIADARGIHHGALQERLDTTLNGLRVWVTSHKLRSAVLEIWRPGESRPVERYDLELAYNPPSADASERFETRIDMLDTLLADRQKLPAGAFYKLLVALEPGAPLVPGWSPAAFGDVSHLQRQDVGEIISTACHGVTFAAWL